MNILEISLDVSFILVMLGVAFAFVRLIKGPSLSDRVVALDMMTILIVSFCGLYAILSDDHAFIDVAIVLALVGFLATAALARFVERADLRSEEGADPEVEAPGADGPHHDTEEGKG